MSFFQRLKHVIIPQPRRPLRLLQIEPSLDCSLDCVMCPWTDLRLPGSIMSAETFAALTPHLALAESVDFTGGGEPLKNPRIIEMVAAAKAAGCTVGFSTNAMRLNEDVAQGLVQAGLDWISFSVDAATPELYERIRQGAHFNVITEHIAGLRDLIARRGQGPRLMMVFVVMAGEHQNYHQLPQFIELAHRLGVTQVIAKNLDVILKADDDQRRVFSHSAPEDDAATVAAGVRQAFEQARQVAERLGVGLRFYSLQPQELTVCEHNPLGALFVNWEGRVAPCITLAYAEQRIFDGQPVHVPCQIYGNACHQPLPEIWAQPEYAAFRSHFAARLRTERQASMDHLLGGSGEAVMPPAPEGCRTCYYLYGV